MEHKIKNLRNGKAQLTAELAQTRLSRADLIGAKMGANLEWINLDGVNLDDVKE